MADPAPPPAPDPGAGPGPVVQPGLRDPTETSRADQGVRVLFATPYRVGFFGCLGVLTAYVLVEAALQVSSILLMVVVALFLSLGLNPLVELLTRRRIPRVLAVLVVFLVLAAAIALVVLAVVPVFTVQINELLRNAPGWLGRLRQNPVLADLDAQYQVITRISDFLTSGDLISTLFGGLLGAGQFIANALVATLVTLVLTLYFMSSMPSIKQVVYQLSPASQRARVRYLADQIFSRVGSYLTGMFVVVVTAGVLCFIFLTVIGLGEYALAVAAVVSLLSFIPLVGSTLSLVLVTLVCFTASVPLGIAGLVYYLVYQQLEAYLLYPRVMASSVKVPGPVTVIAALIFGTLLGIVGALIAVPTAAALLILYREVLIPRLDRS